jgi:hypothetical protein
MVGRRGSGGEMGGMRMHCDCGVDRISSYSNLSDSYARGRRGGGGGGRERGKTGGKGWSVVLIKARTKY